MRFAPHQNIKRFRLLAVLLALFALLIPHFLNRNRSVPIGAGKLYFAQAPSTSYYGQQFQLELRVRSLVSPINAAGIYLTYNPKAFDVIKMTTDQSFCTFYTENTFDTIKGEVRLSCGIPHPGFSGDSTLLTLQVRSKATGKYSFTLSPSETLILADDGKASPLRLTIPTYNVTVIPST